MANWLPPYINVANKLDDSGFPRDLKTSHISTDSDLSYSIQNLYPMEVLLLEDLRRSISIQSPTEFWK